MVDTILQLHATDGEKLMWMVAWVYMKIFDEIQQTDI